MARRDVARQLWMAETAIAAIRRRRRRLERRRDGVSEGTGKSGGASQPAPTVAPLQALLADCEASAPEPLPASRDAAGTAGTAQAKGAAEKKEERPLVSEAELRARTPITSAPEWWDAPAGGFQPGL